MKISLSKPCYNLEDDHYKEKTFTYLVIIHWVLSATRVESKTGPEENPSGM